MNKTIKIVVLFIIISAAAAAGYYLGELNQKKVQNSIVEQQVKNEEPQIIEQTKDQELEELFIVPPEGENAFPKSISGKIVGISPDSWVIDQPTGAREVKVKADTPIFKSEGSKKMEAQIVDIKVGTEIEAQLNEQTGEVLKAIITK